MCVLPSPRPSCSVAFLSPTALCWSVPWTMTIYPQLSRFYDVTCQSSLSLDDWQCKKNRGADRPGTQEPGAHRLSGAPWLQCIPCRRCAAGPRAEVQALGTLIQERRLISRSHVEYRHGMVTRRKKIQGAIRVQMSPMQWPHGRCMGRSAQRDCSRQLQRYHRRPPRPALRRPRRALRSAPRRLRPRRPRVHPRRLGARAGPAGACLRAGQEQRAVLPSLN